MSELIISNPEKTLGSKVIKEHGHSVEILVKLNQAKGNSYQVHAKAKTSESSWIPKPESWYFLEPGLVTLGLKKDKDWQEYKKVCELIYKESKLISSFIEQGEITVEEGRKRLNKLIKKHDPIDWVNLIQIAKDAAVDLSGCGVHHSWEQNQETHPLGNIVYEVQKNVYDPDCTIRAFDRGKIKDDGTIRPLHIDDYFHHLDKNDQPNDPNTHYSKGEIVKKTSTQTVKQIFTTKHYSLQELTFTKPISNQFTLTSDSFHHLFVRSGAVVLQWNDLEWTITQGFGVFIPAGVGQYSLKPYKQKHAKVLKTYL